MNVKSLVKPFLIVVGVLILVALGASLGSTLLMRDSQGFPVWFLYLWSQGQLLAKNVEGPLGFMAVIGTLGTIVSFCITDDCYGSDRHRKTVRGIFGSVCAVGLIGYFTMQMIPTTETMNFIMGRMPAAQIGKAK